ncbi:MAG: DUF116 domain-containing protein, partial [Planctomycetota bacterium]
MPETREMRDRLMAECRRVAATLDRDAPMTKDDMEKVARQLLQHIDMPEAYVGWTMVMLSSAFWEDGVKNVPPERRLFLLPHCLKHAEGCPAEYDQFGLNCKTCGACSIADFRGLAEEMGYRVLVAEGSPVVMKIIVGGYVDAVIGVACLNVLEKAIDKILLAGIPCAAVPLLSSDCRNTSVDEDWVDAMVRIPYEPAQQKTRTYMHLMRQAEQLFDPPTVDRLIPPARLGSSEGLGSDSVMDPATLRGVDPILATEKVAYDFLMRGGKHSRPFITMAAYDAMSGGDATKSDGDDAAGAIPDTVRRAAISIETFHKASLVHDDIQDDDSFRYGQPALHRRFGAPVGINLGDYLIGLGYRAVSCQTSQAGAEITADVLDCLATSHMRLSEGQGAELMWRDGVDKHLTPLDALKIYALKTAPAFEAALFCGIRMATDAEPYNALIRGFSRNMGVAFQILNDLGDWEGDNHNKLITGGDILGGRPTVLWALALAKLNDDQRAEMLAAANPETPFSDLTVAIRSRSRNGVSG